MSASRLRGPLIADRGPNVSSADYAASRRRQQQKSKRRHSSSSSDEEEESKSGADDEEDVRMPHIPGVASAKKARYHAEIVNFDVMDDDDWSDDFGLGVPSSSGDPRTVRAGDNREAQAHVDELMRKGGKSNRDAIMDAYLQERAARVMMERQQADRDAMDVEHRKERGEEEPSADADADLDCEALFARMRLIAETERAEAVARQRIHTRAHLATDKLVGANVRKGDLRLAAIRKCLADMGYTRSQFQELFHNKFIQACLPQIYGDEWPECSERVLEEFGIKKINYEVLIQTPRRLGKTISVAMFVCCMLLCCPEVRICVFSTGKRASSAIMLEVIKIITYMGHSNRIVKKNSEQRP